MSKHCAGRLLLAAILLVSSIAALSITPRLVAATQTRQVTVYVTKTGKKYHRESCGYLKKSKISISLKDAKAQGCTPCKRCKPPT